MPVEEKEDRNEASGDDIILEGRPISKKTSIQLTTKDIDIAHRSVLLNTAMMEPFLE